MMKKLIIFISILLCSCAPVMQEQLEKTGANTQLKNMTQDDNLGMDSIFYSVDDPAGTPVDRKVTAQEIADTVLADMVEGDIPSTVILESEINTSAELAALFDDETGSGSIVFATSPTLVTPVLGTIASGVGTALTALNGENIQDDTIDDDSIDLSDITLADFTDDIGAQRRLSMGLTAQTFTASDATPDVSNGGSSIVQLWRSVDTTTITDFDDGDDHSEFSDGDAFILIFNSAQEIDCSDNPNIKGHGNNDYEGAAGEFAIVEWDGTNNYWIFKPSEIKTQNFSTLRVPNNESTDAVLANLGEIHVRGDEDRFSFHMGTGGEIAGEATQSMLNYGCWTWDPGAAYDSDAEWFLFDVEADVWPNGIIIDEWKASFNLDPDVELNADLRYADAWIGLANAADIDEIDTTNGVSSEDTDANINAGAAVAAGKVIYIGNDGDPEGTGTQVTFCMSWHGEED